MTGLAAQLSIHFAYGVSSAFVTAQLPDIPFLARWLEAYPMLTPVLGLTVVSLLAYIAFVLAKRYVLRAVHRVVSRTRFTWDDVLQEFRVFERLAHIAPALVFYYALPVVPGLPAVIELILQHVATAVMVVVTVVSAGAFLTAANEIYNQRPEAKHRPIKGYIQIVKIFLYVLGGIVAVAILVDRSPVVFLSGLGALTAVILLIFRDTILSLVASVQLTSNDMIRVGDWIEMPKYDADGDVIDIALHTVKVQNWDKTITTIPTHKLIDDSFKNWRGMTASGGRRIKRAFNIDVNTIRFLTDDEIERLGRYELLRDYLDRKLAELEAERARTADDPDSVPNVRRLTNIGTFRAYVVQYLRQHPRLHQAMTLMVRQRSPSEHGLPLEVYTFTSTTDWVTYEGIQSDIFDHLLAIVPEFGLRVYQAPAGTDLRALARAENGAT